MNIRSKKGFTLVEIMIVVVIIALLAAMAIPAFKKVRQNSRKSAMTNDARQLASAAQQYFLENSVTTTGAVSLANGVIGTPLTAYVKQIGSGYTTTTITFTAEDSFSLEHPILIGMEGAVGSGGFWYNSEGQIYK